MAPTHPGELQADDEPAQVWPEGRGRQWQVQLLGGLTARNGEVTLTHFVSHAIGALLARLVLLPRRDHPREELIELLWPGVEIGAGRNRLRHALSTLRRLLEPPGRAGASVLLADRLTVRLNAEAVGCDALDFEHCMREGDFAQARALYRGDLLPGFYDEWIQVERARLAALFEHVTAASGEVPVGGPRPLAAPHRRSHAEVETDVVAPTLPFYLTRLVGREAECGQLMRRVATQRLVILSGIGGCGKTRLAVEVARRTRDFELVAFVPLADCTAGGPLAEAVRVALRLPGGTKDALAQVIAALAGRHALVVLDSFEQLVDGGGGALVETLLARAPRLHLLVTSRRVLGVPGEQEFTLAPLRSPEADASIEQVAANPSVALFVDRARSVRPDFQVTARNCEALAALCRGLEGVPLAIELAASRSRAFSPRDMHRALAQRFSLLARTGARGAGRGTAARHDSLRAAIDWSWRLLQPHQQRFLSALSVFRGGWALAAAHAVCDEPRAGEQLDALVSDSLLRGEPDAHDYQRFFMLEMIRDFVGEQLAPAEAQTLRRQHRAHYLALVVGQRARGALELDAAELPNVYEALRTAVDDGEPGIALHLGLAARSHWDSKGIASEALGWLRRAIDAAHPSDRSLAPACAMVALLLLSAGDGLAAQALADRALAVAAEQPVARAVALCTAARIALDLHRNADGLIALLEEARALARDADARDIEAQAVALLGTVELRVRHDAARADLLLAQACGMQVAAGQLHEAIVTQFERAMCLREMGRPRDALAQAQALEVQCLAMRDRQRALGSINLQGGIHSDLREWRAALHTYRRCAELAWQTHNYYWLGLALWNQGRNLARLRQAEQAGLLMAFSEHYWATHFGSLGVEDQRYARQVRRLVRYQLGAARTDALWRRGRQMGLSEVVRLVRRD